MRRCILMLLNAIVGFPEELKARLKLRAELIRLQLLDVLATAPTPRMASLHASACATELAGRGVRAAAGARRAAPRAPRGGGAAGRGLRVGDARGHRRGDASSTLIEPDPDP